MYNTVTYFQNFTDNWITATEPLNITPIGTENLTTDAYVILKTPLGSFTNTLRIKRQQTINTISKGSPNVTTNVVTYMWFLHL